MPLNLTIWKINNFFLILYGEISVLIGPIPRLFVTGAFVTDHSIQSPFGIYVKPNMYLEYQNVFQCNFISYESYQYWNIVNIFLIAFMFKVYIINCFHSGSMSKYIITESDFCLLFQEKYLYDTFAQHIGWLSIQNSWMFTWISPPVLRNKCYME